MATLDERAAILAQELLQKALTDARAAAEDARLCENRIADVPGMDGKDRSMPVPMKILGPYRHARGNRWRICTREHGKPDRWEYFETEDKAKDEANRRRREVRSDSTPTIDAALTGYEHVKAADENRKRSIETTTGRLRFLFKTVLTEPIGTLTQTTCQRLADALTTRPTRFKRPMASTTRLGTVAEAKTFTSWAVEQRWLRTNPFDDVKVRGRKARGKPQLGEDDAVKLFAYCLPKAQAGDEAAIAVLVALCHGPRASEIVSRKAAELDGGGRLLRITESKTEAGKRPIRLVPLLQPMLVKLAEGKPPEAPLFGSTNRHWLRRHVIRLCEEAGVPRVTSHGLRGTWTTLDIEGAELLDRTASQLGHEHHSTSTRHYARPGAVDTGRSRRVVSILEARARPTAPADNGAADSVVSDRRTVHRRSQPPT